MNLAIYKPGQGYWTRTLSAIGAGTLVVAGAAWLWDKLTLIQNETVRDNLIYFQAGVAVFVIALFGGLLFWLLNKPNIADFMISTETEMKKVNWPTKKEIVGSTWIVICGTILFALILAVIDVIFGYLFIWIGILNAGG